MSATSRGQRDASFLPYDPVNAADFRPDPARRLNHVEHIEDGTVYHVSSEAYEYLTGQPSEFVNTDVPIGAEVTIGMQRQIEDLTAQLEAMRQQNAQLQAGTAQTGA